MADRNAPRRDPITPEQMAAISHHEGWEDGRTGFLWCRFDSAVLGDDPRLLRAEVTWDDDVDEEYEGSGGYFNSLLTVESNGRRADGSLATLDKRDILITHEQALAILAGPPEDLLVAHAAEFALLLPAPREVPR